MSIFKKLWVALKLKQFKFAEKRNQKNISRLNQYDERLVQRLSSKRKLPTCAQFKFISKYLSPLEIILIRIFLGIALISIGSLLINVYWTNSKIAPESGGSYTEGLVGSPRYINPLFSQANDVDLDLSSLVFSSLLKYSEQGPIKDLARDYQISADQKIYTFQLREDVIWHDGEKLTADDVIFTFARIINNKTKTPLFYNFQGVSIEKISDYQVKFTLVEPFAPFWESLTIGIIPEHIWKNIAPENMTLAEYNLKPVGSGPYRFKSLVKNKNGTIKTFNIEKNESYYESPAYIEDISLKFYPNFEQAVSALNNQNVEGISYLPKELRARIINNRNLNFHILNLPQYTAVFFNYGNNPVLKNVKIRKILSHSTNKEKIVNELLNAEAQIIDNPILPGSLGYLSDTPKYPFNISHAQDELEKAGWTLSDYNNPKSEDNKHVEEYPYQVRKYKNTFLEFTLTMIDQPGYAELARELQKEWQMIGVKLNLAFADAEKIQTIIKERDYDALLYSQISGYDPDPYPFWHSSQKHSRGLNLTSLENTKIDQLLETARKTSDENSRAAKYSEFQKLIIEEAPAIFLYNPTYTYPQNKKIKGFNTSKIFRPADRFNQIADWYIKTNREWGE